MVLSLKKFSNLLVVPLLLVGAFAFTQSQALRTAQGKVNVKVEGEAKIESFLLKAPALLRALQAKALATGKHYKITKIAGSAEAFMPAGGGQSITTDVILNVMLFDKDAPDVDAFPESMPWDTLSFTGTLDGTPENLFK